MSVTAPQYPRLGLIYRGYFLSRGQLPVEKWRVVRASSLPTPTVPQCITIWDSILMKQCSLSPITDLLKISVSEMNDHVEGNQLCYSKGTPWKVTKGKGTVWYILWIHLYPHVLCRSRREDHYNLIQCFSRAVDWFRPELYAAHTCEMQHIWNLSRGAMTMLASPLSQIIFTV